MFLPATLGGLLTSLLDLPITVAAEFDGNVPAVGVLIDVPGESRPRTAVGLHVQIGDRMIATLTKGESARFTARVDAANQITILEPKVPQKDFSLGVLGNYLLVADDPAGLTSLGPYVARTLGARSASKDDLGVDVSSAALGGPLRARLEKRWADLRPLFDLAGSANGVEPLATWTSSFDEFLTIMSDLDGAHLTVNLDPGNVRVRATSSAKAGQGPASRIIADLPAGDAKPMLDLPAGSLLALVYRETAAGRKASALERTDLLVKALGKDLKAADHDALAKATEGLAAGRGDWFTAGVRVGGTGPAVYIRGAVADPDLLARSIEDLVRLFKQEPGKRLAEDRWGPASP